MPRCAVILELLCWSNGSLFTALHGVLILAPAAPRHCTTNGAWHAVRNTMRWVVVNTGRYDGQRRSLTAATPFTSTAACLVLFRMGLCRCWTARGTSGTYLTPVANNPEYKTSGSDGTTVGSGSGGMQGNGGYEVAVARTMATTEAFLAAGHGTNVFAQLYLHLPRPCSGGMLGLVKRRRRLYLQL